MKYVHNESNDNLSVTKLKNTIGKFLERCADAHRTEGSMPVPIKTYNTLYDVFLELHDAMRPKRVELNEPAGKGKK